MSHKEDLTINTMKLQEEHDCEKNEQAGNVIQTITSEPNLSTIENNTTLVGLDENKKFKGDAKLI